LDIRQDWNEQYPDYTILDVNVTPSMREGDVMLERLEVSSDTIKEFFEKKGLSNQSELLSECIKLFEEYGR
jgi:hypothetical protein